MNISAEFKYLTCPIDGLPLNHIDSTLKCKNNHCFDISKRGYVNLLPVQYKKSKHPGDSKEMVLARKRFLNTDIYLPIAKNLLNILKQNIQGDTNAFIIDAGCGEGYYLDFIYSHLNHNNLDFLGLDISKEAVVEASKRNKNISWIVASNKNLPIQDKSADTIICQFGFPVYEEFRRVLKPHGKVILIDTAESHLIEIRKIIYKEIRKSAPPSLEKTINTGFELIHTENLKYRKYLDSNQQIMDLLQMTPHLFRATKEGKETIMKLDNIEITIDISFRILYR